MNSEINKTKKVSTDFKNTLWEFVFWPFSFLFDKSQKAESISNKIWNLFYWGRLWPFKKYFYNRNSVLLKNEYPDLNPQQIDFISSWSLTAPWFPVIWSLNTKLKRIAVIFALNYLLIILAVIILSLDQDFKSLPIIIISTIFAFIVLYAFVIARIYFTFNAKRLSWEKGWSSFDEFKNKQNKLDKIIWRTINVILIILLILLIIIILNLKRQF